MEALAQHVTGWLAVPGISAAIEVKVFMDSGSDLTAILEELAEALRGQPGMTHTALTQVFVGDERVVTSLGQERDIEMQSCLLHLTIETPWGPVRFIVPFIVLPVVFIGQKTFREKLGIDVMAQLKASVLKAHGRQDGAWVELTACAMGEPSVGAMLRAAMALMAFGPSGGPLGDVDDDVTLELQSERPMIFQYSEVDMQDRVGALDISVDDVVDLGLQKRANIVPNIVFRTHLDVLCWPLLGDPPARKKPVAVPLHSSARVVRAKSPPARNRLPWSAAESCRDCRSVVTSISVEGTGEGLKEAESTWGLVSLVFHDAWPCWEESSRRCC